MHSDTHAPEKSHRLTTIGWKEWVGLPDLGIKRIKVKVDSGAQTSALHATHIEYIRVRGEKWVKFQTNPLQRTSRGHKSVSAPLVGEKIVKSSIGVYTKRPTIRTTLRIGKKRFTIKITLIDRDVMGFRMLLGREAIRHRFLIDVSRSFVKKKVKKSAAD